ncbi:MAG: PD40 domain-containing protein [Bacteroidetes bacterium]|nr:PD40 domain-containing protein [Bacteroidota bacterium]
MKTSTIIKLLALLIIMATGITTSSFSQKPEQLYQQGLIKEEGEGSLQEAIDIYNKVAENTAAERSLRAKAQLHIGMCYEKLGMKEAKKAYQLLLTEYPNQRQEVAIAKERLDEIARNLEKVSLKPTFTKIRIPSKPSNGVLSPDGEKLAFTSQGSVWIVPVQGKVQPNLSGEPYMLTEPMEASNFGNTLAWSGNGKWIAFNAVDNKKDAIYVISVTGGKPKKISVDVTRSGGGNMHDHRLSLSPDGKLLAFSSSDFHSETVNREKEEPFSIYTISVDDGIITHLTDDFTEQPAFSPDGKMIAFVKKSRLKDGKQLYEGWMIPASGGTPIRVTEPSIHVMGPLWSPDGRMIAFNSRKDPEHDNINQVVIVSISEDGRPLNSRKVIKLPQITFLIPAGWSQNNTMGFHLVNPRYQAIYSVPFPGGKATQVTPEGWGNNPCWSLDGKEIFFRWETGIVSIPYEGGKVSIVPLESDEKIYSALPGGGIHLSPDGKSIVFAGVKEGHEGVHIMIVPVEGGEPAVITQSPTQDRFPCWSPDGKNIAFIRYHGNSKGNIVMDIYVISSNGGEAKQITSENENVDWSSIKFSPDGNHIAYFSRDSSIKMIPLQGGKPKEIVKVKSLNSHNEIIMLKDGKHMVYTSDWKIWMVSLDGGEPTQIKTGLNNWFHSQIAQSPDGKKLAFTAFNVTVGDSDLWLMEDFLPEKKDSK